VIPTSLFPPRPLGLKGRKLELTTLSRAIDPRHPRRFALVGQGGSGKSLLACALGHRVRRAFEGNVHWFRVGGWDARTLAEMLAIRFGTPRDRRRLYPGLSVYLSKNQPTFIVLDNHENDRAMATFLDALRSAKVTWVITARRCLLSGVTLYPVTAPLVTAGKSAFPRVRTMTKLLRHHPLALDIANALVSSDAIDVRRLSDWLVEHGVERVRAVDHEDDLPEVSLLVGWAWQRLDTPARRLLALLARLPGDHAGSDSMFELVGAQREGPAALAKLRRWHLVDEPFHDRFALHAVVRHAIGRICEGKARLKVDPRRIFEHYVALLERHPDRLDLEQTHLFAAMDFAHTTSDLRAALRVDRLLSKLGAPSP
jgi:hypothetical protein